jgi:hypothetical protein
MKRVVGTVFAFSWLTSVALIACSSSGIGGSITATGTSDGGADGSSTSQAPQVTIEASCQTYAAAYCNKINSCSAPLFAQAYLDMATSGRLQRQRHARRRHRVSSRFSVHDGQMCV